MSDLDNNIRIAPTDALGLVAIPEEELFALVPLPAPTVEELQGTAIAVANGNGAAKTKPKKAKGTTAKQKRLKTPQANAHDGQEDPEELTPEDQVIVDMLDEIMSKQDRSWDINDHDLMIARMRCIRVINQANKRNRQEPVLYHYASHLAQLEPNEDGRMTIKLMSRVRMRHLLSVIIEFYRLGKKKDGCIPKLKEMAPPWLCDDVLIAPNPDLPILEAVINVPRFIKNGNLLTERGYCRVSRLFYDPSDDLIIPAIPAVPTPADVIWARSLIVDELFGDFPFTGPADRANAVALFLLPFVRGLIDGPTPLHLIEKPTAGTGGSLIAEVVTLVAEGRPAAGTTAPAGEEEMRKELLSQFKGGAKTILFDNLRHKLDSASLASALMFPEYEGRLLGVSTILRFKVNCTWIATANNPKLSQEIKRRTVSVRLDAKMDEPWRRPPETFRHPELLVWAAQERVSLIRAALILGRAWVSAGRPASPQTPSLANYESWRETLGGILHIAGIPGFLTNLDDLYETVDDETVTLKAFITAWWHAHGAMETRVSELFALADAIDPPLALGDRSERSQRIRLGRILADLRDRQFNIDLDQAQAAQWGRERLDVRVTSAGTTQNAQLWKLVPAL